MSTSVKVTTHLHPLKPTTQDNGWACDGRNVYGGCVKGCSGFGQTRGWKRFRCDYCDYDLCEGCLEKHRERRQTKSVRCHRHMLDLVDGSGGWACDGRKLPGGCVQGCTGFRQCNGWTRFRCDPCDFDLCEGCVTREQGNANSPAVAVETPTNFNVRCHRHPLSKDNTGRGWLCDGRNLPSGCVKGCRALGGSAQTIGWDRYRCEACDFDLCEGCLNRELVSSPTRVPAPVPAPMPVSIRVAPSVPPVPARPAPVPPLPAPMPVPTRIVPSAPAVPARPAPVPSPSLLCRREVTCHNHPVELSLEDNGWMCNGARLAGGCVSGCTTFNQTTGWKRYKCKFRECDFDLCEGCVSKYDSIGGVHVAVHTVLAVPAPKPTTAASEVIPPPAALVAGPREIPFVEVDSVNAEIEGLQLMVRQLKGERSSLENLTLIDLDHLKDMLQKGLQNIDARIQEIRMGDKNTALCLVCETNPKNMLLLPCRHLCLCSQCSTHPHFRLCPICRQAVTNKMEVFA